MDTYSIIPLIINGEEVLAPHDERRGEIVNKPSNGPRFYQGATKGLALQAVESSANAYKTWSKTTPIERRRLLWRLAEVCC